MPRKMLSRTPPTAIIAATVTFLFQGKPLISGTWEYWSSQPQRLTWFSVATQRKQKSSNSCSFLSLFASKVPLFLCCVAFPHSTKQELSRLRLSRYFEQGFVEYFPVLWTCLHPPFPNPKKLTNLKLKFISSPHKKTCISLIRTSPE